MTSTAEVQQVVQEWAAAFDPALVTATDAARIVDAASEVAHLAAYVKMVAAERVAATSAWHGSGKKSPQDWLADRTGTSTNEAAETLKTARKLKRLPKTRKAMARGKLSAAQAGAVADAAEADPEAEDSLLETADKATLKNLKDEAARVKAAATDDAQRERRNHARRSLRTYIDRDGAFNLHLRSTQAAGTRLLARMRAHQEQAFRTHRSDGIRDSYEARAHDALLATLGLDPHGRPLPPPAPPPGSASPGPTDSAPKAHTKAVHPDAQPPGEPPATSGGHDSTEAEGADSSTDRRTSPTATDPPGDPDPDRSPPPPPSGSSPPGDPHGPQPDETSPEPTNHPPDPPPHPTGTPPDPEPPPPAPPPPAGGNNIKVIVRIDHTALTRGHAIAGETVEVAGLGPISVTTAKELMSDAFLAAVITKGRDVHTVAHLGRAPNAFQRTALESQHIDCSNLGCNGTIGIQIDHRDPWAETHQTPTSGLDPRCPHCHRLKTHHGHQLEPGTGPRRLLTPDELRGTAGRPSAKTGGRAAPGQPNLGPAPSRAQQGSLL